MVNIRIAYNEAISPPELVPPIMSIFILLSSSAFNTPACAIPLIPPPDNAIPNFKFSPSSINFSFYIVFTNFMILNQKCYNL